MKKFLFKFVGNACGIFIGTDGTKILCDPWLIDGVFEGSWSHFPKLKTTLEDVSNVDAIYISHLHPDHFDERNFSFNKSIPIIALDHGPNFLIKKLTSLGYLNILRIKDQESIQFKEFKLTMFAPFAKHNFHDSVVGNLIDSALLISCNNISAINANDNTLSLEASKMIRDQYGLINLAMLNYNAAGPYPSCFENLSYQQKIEESNRILERNFTHIENILKILKPDYVLPFAGAYVLGGSLREKNKYLGTTTWDECAKSLATKDIGSTKIVLMRENDCLDIKTGVADNPYVPIDLNEMNRYIEDELSQVEYPYQQAKMPDKELLFNDIERATKGMKARMDHFGIFSKFNVVLEAFGEKFLIYPYFAINPRLCDISKKLECRMDERLLRKILDRSSHWNNAEIGGHITYRRVPNEYEPDLHTGLQFFHI